MESYCQTQNTVNTAESESNGEEAYQTWDN